MSKPIFISHAVKDKHLADMIVDLLETGVGIPSNNVFCSSLEGLSIPSGVNFIDFIKRQIEKPQIVILLITENYYESSFCLCELGASWALSHKTIPLIVEPLEFKDLKSVLIGIEARKILDKGDLNEIHDELIDELNFEGHPIARWEVKRDKFINTVSEKLPIESDNNSVSKSEFEKVEQNYEEAKQEISSLLTELDKKEALIEELKSAKDSDQVKSIIHDQLENTEEFEKLKDQAKNDLSDLPTIVCEAIFHYCRGEEMPWPGWDNDYLIKEIEQAIRDDYLIDHGEVGVSIVTEDPKINTALTALNELEEFITYVESSDLEFVEYYSNTYDHRLNFESKRFWDTHLL